VGEQADTIVQQPYDQVWIEINERQNRMNIIRFLNWLFNFASRRY